jgi:hypothetical protein
VAVGAADIAPVCPGNGSPPSASNCLSWQQGLARFTTSGNWSPTERNRAGLCPFCSTAVNRQAWLLGHLARRDRRACSHPRTVYLLAGQVIHPPICYRVRSGSWPFCFRAGPVGVTLQRSAARVPYGKLPRLPLVWPWPP